MASLSPNQLRQWESLCPLICTQDVMILSNDESLPKVKPNLLPWQLCFYFHFQSNTILVEQIAEVESTLESFDNYLNTVKSKPCLVPPETLKREMYAFQEVMIERIFSCIEVLGSEMKTLRKTDQTKAAKVKDFLARYEAVKKESPEALLIVGELEVARTTSPAYASSKLATSGLKKCLQAVVTGIEYFHTSCEDIWDETMSRIFSELETMFLSLPTPPAKRWTPDDPCVPSASMSLSSLDGIEEDIGSVKMLPKDKSKYGAMVIFSLHVLERVASELVHLMVVTRIKDLQMISIDHSIGMAYMSMRQMVLPTIKNNPSCSIGKSVNRKKPWKFKINEQKRKAQKTIQTKPKSLELARDERKSKKKLSTNINIDRRMLKHRLYEKHEPADEATDARLANKGLMSEQLQTDNAHHMGAAADMRLPLIHLEDFCQAVVPGATRCSLSQSSGLSPWAQPRARHGSENTQKDMPIRRAKTNPSDGLRSTKAKTNFPKIPTTAHQIPPRPLETASSKPPAVTSSKPPAAPVSSKNTAATSSQKPPNACTRTNSSFIQETAVLRNEKNELVDCMGNKIQDRENHRPIQYCRFLAAPVPPSANLISNESRAAQEKHASRKISRKPRFRLTSADQDSPEVGNIHGEWSSDGSIDREVIAWG